ncbi:MAG: efflux RND transporter periplasmic adaptor subunit [Candidatus Omnitrophica bacterium]|nr:efflux RND transporter periplasmic adaptor subunit [Candidatus Omnitrophota bacterium]
MFFWLLPVALIFLLVLMLGGRKEKTTELVWRVQPGDFRVTVLVGGTLKAVRSQDIISDVEGQNMILDIVPEGTVVTESDVKDGKVLVRLDSSRVGEQLAQEEINLQNAETSATDARENYQIQINQNDSNIRKGELSLTFARMELEKYLGSRLTESVLKQKGEVKPGEIFVSPDLEGEAQRQVKQFKNAIDLAKEQLSRDQDRLDWTKKLVEKGYATRGEQEADNLAVQQRVVATEQAQTAYLLFNNYDFPKELTKRLSDFREAGEELIRIKANARAQLSQAQNRLVTRQASYQLTQNKVKRYQDQVEISVMVATQPGIVVYASSANPFQSRQGPIQAGATVNQRQVIITLPDISQMSVELKVPESSIDKIREGQVARVTVDAFPGMFVAGKVRKMALLPDATMRWMNPDINVYTVEVVLDQGMPDLRPGMSTQVEILVAERKNVLSIPLSALRGSAGSYRCVKLARRRSIEVPVAIGLSNDSFVEVQSGLRRGDTVVLSGAATLPTLVSETPKTEKVAPVEAGTGNGPPVSGQPAEPSGGKISGKISGENTDRVPRPPRQRPIIREEKTN